VTCPFKQSNLSAWSLSSWHPTHTHFWVRLSVFFKAVCSPPSRSRRVTRSMSIEALLFNGFGWFTRALSRVQFFAFVPRVTCAPRDLQILFFLSLSLCHDTCTSIQEDVGRRIHRRGGEGARKGYCVWGGYFVSSWSVSGTTKLYHYPSCAVISRIWKKFHQTSSGLGIRQHTYLLMVSQLLHTNVKWRC